MNLFDVKVNEHLFKVNGIHVKRMHTTFLHDA